MLLTSEQATSAPLASDDAELQHEVDRRMTERYLAVMRQIGVASLVGTSLLAGGFYLHLRDPALLFWWAAILVFGIAWARVGQGPVPGGGERDLRALERRILVFASASGVSYGGAIFVLFRPGETLLNSVVILASAMGIGMTAAGNHWLKRATASWCALFGAIVALRLALEPGFAYRLVAVCLVFYTCMHVWFAIHANAVQAESLKQALLNERLAARLDEQVRRAEAAGLRAERASQEKSRFLAAASHDLRQPLYAICLLTDSMRSRLAGGPHHAHFGRLASSVGELAESLNTILDISWMDAGHLPMRLEPVSVADLVAVIHRRYGERAMRKGLDFRMFHRDQAIWADKGLMERLLGNLVENAIKYTRQGGVLVAARSREASGVREVVIEVRDSGTGISAAAHEAIFEEFYQVGNAARERTEGLGLGLSIVRRLAAAMNLRIGLRSAPGCGSTFSVTCPAAALKGNLERIPATDADAEDLAVLRDLRVLLVDNERAILDAAADVLAAWGMQVSTASHAAEALERAEATPFDVGVLDFRLGASMNGLELAQALRASQGHDFPVLIITGDTDPDVLARLRGADVDLLLKPIQGPALALAIAQGVGAAARKGRVRAQV